MPSLACYDTVDSLRKGYPKEWVCSTDGSALDSHSADAGSIPRCSREFSSQSQLSVQTLLWCPYHPHMQSRASTSMHTKDDVDHVRGQWIMGNTKASSMHHRLGSMTLSELAFPRECNLNFPWEISKWNNTVKKKKRVVFSVGFLQRET